MIPMCMRRVSFKNDTGEAMVREMEVYHVSKEEMLNICLKFYGEMRMGNINNLQKFVEDKLKELE